MALVSFSISSLYDTSEHYTKVATCEMKFDFSLFCFSVHSIIFSFPFPSPPPLPLPNFYSISSEGNKHLLAKLFAFHLYTEENAGLEKLCNLPKVTLIMDELF